MDPFMVHDILINKAAIIERYLKRIEEEYRGHEDELETDFTRQDSIILNLQRACEAAIDAGMHIVKIQKLGIPQQSRDAFEMLYNAGIVERELKLYLQAMVGFRNVAVHDYRTLNLAVVKSILENRLYDFRAFARVLLSYQNDQP
jgi:uncharacterized protein YutE (UPF0331/DUF86 family)